MTEVVESQICEAEMLAVSAPCWFHNQHISVEVVEGQREDLLDLVSGKACSLLAAHLLDISLEVVIIEVDDLRLDVLSFLGHGSIPLLDHDLPLGP